ncbi:MAG TPA: DUF1697 domain-containing protein [Thermoanaerobaculia bacterium]|nr:DUF1697 domain-containing protein [Thermoanaerobaculia bacterium]
MTSQRYAAFLRGMNLGNRRLTNEELCERFAALGLDHPAAFLASGNVVFEAPAGEAPDELSRRLEAGLGAALGYPVPVFLRTGDEIHAIAGHRPFAAGELAQTAGKLQVALLTAAPGAAARESALALAPADDRLAFAGRELYWLPRTGVSGSDLDWKALDRLLGAATIRTHRTIARMAAKFF